LPGSVQLAGFGLALASIWLIARADGQGGSRRGLGLAVLAGVLFGLFIIATRQAGLHAVFWPLAAGRFAAMLLMMAVVSFSRAESSWLRPVWVPILLAGVLDPAANALFIVATHYGRLDVAAVLASLYPASTVILARVLLKERISPTQSAGIIGALLAVAMIAAP
jgi:drug/metabolite transporter (DMT)-like permease